MRNDADAGTRAAGSSAATSPVGEATPSTSVEDAAAASPALEQHLAWLKAFEAREGRPLRVLHVGNIANNAYLNAKFLRSVGVEAHVLSYDYRHVMATPEWEDVELLRDHGDDFTPRFSRRDLGSYRRPRWFVGGSLRVGALRIAELCGARIHRPRLVALLAIDRMVDSLTRLLRLGPRLSHALRLALISPSLFLLKLRHALRSGPRAFADEDAFRAAELVDRFAEAFPQRPDRLRAADIHLYLPAANILRPALEPYDIIQCYATEPIYALMSGKHPYVAFEHGTLRDFTMGDNALHRLTSLAYREADHTFITNGDCLAYAERLKIESYSPVVHPVDVEQHRQDFGDAIETLRGEIGGDVILFCPIRHDWAVKGVDAHLRALPLIKARLSGRLKLVLVRWGPDLAKSEALLESLGCSFDVVWRRSMCRIAMIKHMRAADVVLDQMVLPPFGATAPQAMAAGTLVVASYMPDSTTWMIPEPAPILSAHSPEEVTEAVLRALEPGWRGEYETRARVWVDRYHHPRNVIYDHLNVYRRVLGHER